MSAAYAMRHPEHVSNLVLVSPAGLGGEVHPSFYENLSLGSRFFFGFASALHGMGVTPHGVARFFGESLGRGLVARYESRTGEARDSGEAQIEMLTDYHHQILANPGSGEHALRHVLTPGVGGQNPLAPRLVRDLSPRIPLHFVYGSWDWVRHLTNRSLDPTEDGNGGSVARNVLRERKSLHRAQTSGEGRGSSVGTLQEVQRAGHMLMLDQPEDCARCVANALSTIGLDDVELRVDGAAFEKKKRGVRPAAQL